MKILIKSISNPEVPYPEEPEKKNISAYFKYDERHNCYYIMIVVIQELQTKQSFQIAFAVSFTIKPFYIFICVFLFNCCI